MPEQKLPHTAASLADDLRSIGMEAGATVLVHSSMSQIGYVVGGPVDVVKALMDVVTADGTVVMPTFTSFAYSNPLDWTSPPVSSEWAEIIRRTLPRFDPALTPSTNMGVIPELFRNWPGALRSSHPILSYAAWGRNAEAILENQPLGMMDGEDSPLGRIYRLGGHVLHLGTGFGTCTSIHLATHRQEKRTLVEIELPEWNEDVVTWVARDDVLQPGQKVGNLEAEDVSFTEIGAEFEKTGAIRRGQIGEADSAYFSQSALVDFATEWFNRHPYKVRELERWAEPPAQGGS